MKQKIKLGVVCLARTTFDFNAAKEIFDAKKKELKQLENLELHIIENLVIEVSDAKDAAEKLNSVGVDAIAIISGTFHLGHLALILEKVVRKPILLWGLNELPYNGGKIRLNSVCGVNLNASNLYKSGNDTFHCIVQDNIDETWVDAIRIKVALEQAHIGLLGYRAHGFFNLDVEDLHIYREMGILLDHYEISDMFSGNPSDRDIEVEEKEVKRIFNVSGITEEQVKKVARLCCTAKKFMDDNELTAIAIRCWPEFAATFGISPCAAMSILQSRGYLMGCEGDVEAVISMVATRACGAETPFVADLSQVNLKDDYALMWHCGVAPCNLWDGKCDISLDTYFANGKGVTADFVMKSGNVNLIRIDTARRKTRIFMASGVACDMDKLLKGTFAKVKFENHIRDVLALVTTNGVAHHLVLVYGEYRSTFEMFGKIMQWQVIK